MTKVEETEAERKWQKGAFFGPNTKLKIRKHNVNKTEIQTRYRKHWELLANKRQVRAHYEHGHYDTELMINPPCPVVAVLVINITTFKESKMKTLLNPFQRNLLFPQTNFPSDNQYTPLQCCTWIILWHQISIIP